MTIDNALQIAHSYFGITGQIKQLPGEVDLNYLIKTPSSELLTLKISAPNPSLELFDLQTKVLLHLQQQESIEALPFPLQAKDGSHIIWHENRAVRLLNWIPGRLWAHQKLKTPALYQSLGAACAKIDQALQGFDHPHAHRAFKWDNQQINRVEQHRQLFQDPEQAHLFDHFFKLIQQKAIPKWPQLRKSIIHNDANDYNIIIAGSPEEPQVVSIIDFGDVIHTHTINELAIALAYAMMNQPRPLRAALEVVKGYHDVFPLEAIELEVLYHQVAARLLISVTNAAINKKAHPDNAYLQISESDAWNLLKKWETINPAFAYYSFRSVCGMEPHPNANAFRAWCQKQNFAPILGKPFTEVPYTHLDLRVGSTDLGNNKHFESIMPFERRINKMLENANVEVGVGGYLEIRPVYTTDAYTVMGNEGPIWRSMHLGLDIWMKSGIPFFIPFDGVVEAVQNNAAERDYGPTLIVRHQAEDFEFFTLYGHIGEEVLEEFKEGDTVKAGQQIATNGIPPINGNWPPHLHFQLMLDLLGIKGDFPGVAFPDERSVWQSICPDPNLLIGIPKLEERSEPDQNDILRKRKQKLGKGLSVSYQQPLHVVRGFKQYLYTTDGRRYLDTVNNVAHVGHEHPKVVEAAQKQIGLLNTNSRYLHTEILAYAEKLLQHFPPELSVVHFVNSGSEANELALRMAQTYTGHRDMIAIEIGYHGNTVGTVDVSSYKFDGKGGKGTPPHTQIVPLPDTFRGRYRGEDTSAKYAAHVQKAIDEIHRQGRAPAGFIAESVLSCGGQIVLPEGYLQQAYAAVRAAGGLCIADEVQVGFGRVGSHFWGFELQGVVPDIVTLGKPIGNGHPMAAVVCTRDVADAFANGMEYFSTFGGNPVSCAIGQAVLDVIAEEGLQQQAEEVGAYLRQNLLELQQQFPLIGEVRGPGLFQGFELVYPGDNLQPAAAQAAYLANRMRLHGVLMSTDGPDYNVLKIKPPMCFNHKNVDMMVTLLEKVFQEESMRV